MGDWRMLGLYLGITHSVLQSIAMNLGSGNQQLCLIDMLSSWLRQDVTASWETLAAGLRKISVDAIAVRVEEEKTGEGSGWVIQLV